MSPMVSIIIPIYNSGKTLRRCLDSVLKQTMVDYECLLIDDGSIDESGCICREYAGRDNRFRVFHKENGGVSSARNLGLKNMRGKFVVFIDSDDWALPDYLSNLFGGLHGCDLTIAYSTVHYSDGSYKVENYPSQIIRNSNFNLLFTNNDLSWHTSPWGKLFCKEIIDKNNLLFCENVHIGEDAIFLYSYLLAAESVSVISSTDYCYQAESSGSLTKRINSVESELLGMTLIHNVVDELVKVKCLSQESITTLSWLKASYIRRVLTALYYTQSPKEKRLELLGQLDIETYCKHIYDSSFLGKIYVWLIKRRFFMIYDFLRASIVWFKRRLIR